MIHTYGALSKKFPKKVDIIVHSAVELIKAMEANFKGFRKSIDKDRKYIIVRGDSLKKGKSITEEEVEMNFSEKDWHILPVPLGYGGGGWFPIIAGAVLIIVGAVLTAYGYGAIGIPMMKFGGALMLGGIAMMLAPSPPTYGGYTSREKNSEERPSYLFNGPTNSIEPGLTIPVVYGESFIGSIFISGGLTVEDVI